MQNLGPDPLNPLWLIPAALATAPGAVVVLPVFHPAAPASTLVLGAKTHTRRIPPELAAQLAQQEAQDQGNGKKVETPTHMVLGRVLLTVPADVAMNLRGPVQERHPTFIFQVHRSFYESAVRQAESGIVLATNMPPVSGAGRIVKP